MAAVVTCREIPSGGESDHSTAIWVRADLLTTISSITRDRMRDSFLSTAAHELRTPLTTIAGFSQLLERQLQKPDLDRERLMTLTHELRQQVRRMSNLADDLMKAVTLRETQDSGQQQPCDILSIVQASVDRSRLGIEFSTRHQIAVEADEEVAAFCDPEHLDQILSNLLSNALKFSPDGGTVTVGLARSGDRVASRSATRGLAFRRRTGVVSGSPFRVLDRCASRSMALAWASTSSTIWSNRTAGRSRSRARSALAAPLRSRFRPGRSCRWVRARSDRLNLAVFRLARLGPVLPRVLPHIPQVDIRDKESDQGQSGHQRNGGQRLFWIVTMAEDLIDRNSQRFDGEHDGQDSRKQVSPGRCVARARRPPGSGAAG